MTRAHFYAVLLVAALLLLVWLAVTTDDSNPQLGSGSRIPPSPSEESLYLDRSRFTTTTAIVKVRATRAVRPAPVVVAGSVWDDLCRCECGGNWACNTGNGYSGGLQMDPPFWETYGGLEFAPEPWMATREEQIIVAERGRAARGFHPWPTCARKLGLIP